MYLIKHQRLQHSEAKNEVLILLNTHLAGA